MDAATMRQRAGELVLFAQALENYDLVNILRAVAGGIHCPHGGMATFCIQQDGRWLSRPVLVIAEPTED